MCGIFGTINCGRRKIDVGLVRSLAIINRSRGKESLGFFDSTRKIFKSANDPQDVLSTDGCTKFLDRAERQAWFVCGHTRYSTQGAVCDRNSHPFEYGSVVGAHNGIVSAPNGYEVDSEFLVDLIDKEKNNYQKAFEDENGYWTFAWADYDSDEFFITMHDNTCGLIEYRGAWYFSSDPDHLMSVIGSRELYIFEDGDTVRFNNKGEIEWLENFKTNTSSYKKDWRTTGGSNGYTSYGSYASGSSSVKVTDPDNVAADYDQDIQEIWAEYINQYSGD